VSSHVKFAIYQKCVLSIEGENQLTALPAEIGQLKELWWLEVCNNRLRLLPATIGQLTNLTGLYAIDNQLEQLPPEIGHILARRPSQDAIIIMPFRVEIRHVSREPEGIMPALSPAV